MECRRFEITLVSASDLEDVRKLFKMKVHARVSVGSNPNTEKRTPTDKHGEINPAWNFSMKFTISESMIHYPNDMLVIKLYCKRKLGDRYIGEMHMSMKELYEYSYANGGSAIMTCPVLKGSAQSQGILRFSYRFGEKVTIDKLVLAESVAGWNLSFVPHESHSHVINFYIPLLEVLDTEIHLDAMGLGDAIKNENTASNQNCAKATIFLCHHLDEVLKIEYLTTKDPFVLWNSLKERISSQLKLCGETVNDNDMMEKTLSTFHTSNVLLQQQYREKDFKKYTELSSHLLVDEQNNDLLMKNHENRPTGSASFPEVNDVHTHHARHEKGRNPGCRHGRGRGRCHDDQEILFRVLIIHQRKREKMKNVKQLLIFDVVKKDIIHVIVMLSSTWLIFIKHH
ncbi:putative OTU domain-containing protein-like [Capsicum annuum]|nr:putative OTU domain-containing protein-like [Capsicum annuum]